MDTAHRIANLLNRQERTIPELAAELGLSRNSVHLQMGKLEAAGVVEKSRRAEPSGAGKPAVYYRTVAGGEDAFSSAWKPVVKALVQTISEAQPTRARVKLFEAAGRSLAREAGLSPSRSLTTDVRRSVEAVNTLGAMAEATTRDQRPFVSCHSCPVATLVHTDGQVCKLVAAFFAEATGSAVEVKCQRQGAVVCGFSFDRE